MENPNKKPSNKKINKTNPGESVRTYGNKPISERVGHTDNKSYKTMMNYTTSHDHASRNNKHGLKENIRLAASDPNGNYEIPYKHVKTDFDIIKGQGWQAKNKHFDGLCRDLESETKKNIDSGFLVADLSWSLAADGKSAKVETCIIEEETGRRLEIVDFIPGLKRNTF
uniref:Uncharacterized protein n=1 Tax=viral metagenome TaxID=1070528 RepID=A0A6C0C9B3_9ZZZZ